MATRQILHAPSLRCAVKPRATPCRLPSIQRFSTTSSSPLPRTAARPLPTTSIYTSTTCTATRTFSTTTRLTAKRYTKEHEYISLSNDGTTATIGISTYAAKNLGDVVYVELPEVPMDVGQGDTIGAVESVKSASDIMTPVSGTVVAVNEALQEKPGDINKDPEGEKGWIARIEVQEQGRDELGGLMDEEAYAKFVEE